MKYPNQEGATDAQNARRKWLTILGIVVVVALVLYGLYWLLYARHFEGTNDAYVGGDVVSITSRDPATVVALYADNTQTVRRGQLLIEMDPSVVNVNLASAEANLARGIRAVKGEFSRAQSSGAQVAQAEVALALARTDYQRRQQAAGLVDRVRNSGSGFRPEARRNSDQAASARAAGLDRRRPRRGGAPLQAAGT